MALCEKTALRLWAGVAAIEDHPAEVVKFAQAVEAEVRKDYDALIRQMLEALDATHGWWGNGEWYGPKTPHWHELTSVSRAAARARLEKAP